jgi:DNA-directed RNA polymerase subunit beta
MSVNDPTNTREEYKKLKPPEVEETDRVRVRLFPIWLRIVILVVLILLCTLSGAVVGYGVLGNGKIADVFKGSTWTHIRDLVEKE